MSSYTNEIAHELHQRRADISIIEQILREKVIACKQDETNIIQRKIASDAREKSLQNFDKNIRQRERRVQRDKLKLDQRLAELDQHAAELDQRLTELEEHAAELEEQEHVINHDIIDVQKRADAFAILRDRCITMQQSQIDSVAEYMSTLQVRDTTLVADELALSEATERYNDKKFNV